MIDYTKYQNVRMAAKAMNLLKMLGKDSVRRSHDVPLIKGIEELLSGIVHSPLPHHPWETFVHHLGHGYIHDNEDVPWFGAAISLEDNRLKLKNASGETKEVDFCSTDFRPGATVCVADNCPSVYYWEPTHLYFAHKMERDWHKALKEIGLKIGYIHTVTAYTNLLGETTTPYEAAEILSVELLPL